MQFTPLALTAVIAKHYSLEVSTKGQAYMPEAYDTKCCRWPEHIAPTYAALDSHVKLVCGM